MCDLSPCTVAAPVFPCDRCDGTYCAAHSFYPDHQCSGQKSLSTSAPIVPTISVPAHDTPIDASSDDEDDDAGVVPLGTMPMGTLPIGLQQLDALEAEASMLIDDTHHDDLLTRCTETTTKPATLRVSMWIFHRTCEPPADSLTWLAAVDSRRHHPSELPLSFIISSCILCNEFIHDIALSIDCLDGLSVVLTPTGLEVARARYVAGELDEQVALRLHRAIQRNDAQARLRIGAQVFSLFPPLMWMMFCPLTDRCNTSRPPQTVKDKIAGSFVLTRPNGEGTSDSDVEVEFLRETVTHDGIPCVLSSNGFIDGELQLLVEVDLQHMQPVDRHGLISTLVAADLSRLALPELGTATRRRCTQNCQVCFEDYFPIGRGGRFLDMLLDAGASAPQGSSVEFATEVQELIRRWITTANNWTEPCEDEETQPFQWQLARALGKLKDDHPFASPMQFLRAIKQDSLVRNDDRLKTQLILQAGIGHCREFSEVAFFVLAELARTHAPIGELLGPIVRVEYEDEDHAFVIGGVDVRSTHALDQSDDGEQSDDSDDDTLLPWDLGSDLVRTRTRGWVCDPYLEQAQHRATAWGKHVSYLHDHRAEGEDDAPEPGDLELLAGSEPAFVLIREQYVRPCLYVIVSVDWEGTNLHPTNLEQFGTHHHEFPLVKLTHFVCPQYLCDALQDPILPDESDGDPDESWRLCRGQPDVREIRSAIASAVGPHDEVGLHIHGWSKLIRGAGVEPEHRGLELDVQSRWGDVGHTDYLTTYAPEDLSAIVVHALDLFGRLGLGTPTSFRAGGWAARSELLHAVRSAGIMIDSSAIPASYIQRVSAANQPLSSALTSCWSEIRELPQAFRLEVEGGSPIYEIPNGCGLADYVDEDTMIAAAKDLIAKAKQGQRQLLHIGFHQETGATTYFCGFVRNETSGGMVMMEERQEHKYYPRIKAVLQLLASVTDCEVRYVTVTEAARIFLDHG